jgi:superoxide dismutase, Fe-Mn family
MTLATANRVFQHELPRLPYTLSALEPYFSRETVEYHYGKHHRGYVNNLNALIRNTEFENAPLEEIIKRSSGTLFNNAAQVWNHNFFWKCLKPNGAGNPAGELGRRIMNTFGSTDAFKMFFKQSALDKFGSGWTWLVKTRDAQLAIYNTEDARNPLRTTDEALLVCDVWEHAYYIDFRNDRNRYIDAFLALINWPFVEQNFSK